ncbi:Uma2 family endonuclease [Saccharomonospora xinjiangensis]|uniref:Uma2 family endonuclease n=1 Tax=Saccharomonospora xinjiangensis TaxID=75294 RepID=UPI003510AEDE
MSAAIVDTPLDWDALVRTWHELDVPEGWRPEVTIEGIRMSPPPGGQHNLIADQLHEALVRSRPNGAGVFQTLGVTVPVVGGIYVPDLCVVPRAYVPDGSDPVPSEHVLLAVEITSAGNANHDRSRKRWAYAHGGIEQYLLVDPHDPDGAAVTLFSDPADGAYRKACRIPFGEKITLGSPFGLVVDTTEF